MWVWVWLKQVSPKRTKKGEIFSWQANNAADAHAHRLIKEQTHVKRGQASALIHSPTRECPSNPQTDKHPWTPCIWLNNPNIFCRMIIKHLYLKRRSHFHYSKLWKNSKQKLKFLQTLQPQIQNVFFFFLQDWFPYKHSKHSKYSISAKVTYV